MKRSPARALHRASRLGAGARRYNSMAAAKFCPGKRSMSHSTEARAERAQRGKSALAPACVGLVACAALVVPIRVPKSLAETVQLELSGAVWSPSLGRYALVSDDVNAGGAKH